MDFFSIGNDELADAEVVSEGTVLRNKVTGEDCILHFSRSVDPDTQKTRKEGTSLGFVTTITGASYIVTVGDKLINSDWEVRHGSRHSRRSTEER